MILIFSDLHLLLMITGVLKGHECATVTGVIIGHDCETDQSKQNDVMPWKLIRRGVKGFACYVHDYYIFC